MIAITLLVTTAVGAVAPQDARRDTSTVKQVMLTMTIPSSEVIFSAASDPPKDDAGWQELRRNALVLAESGTALMTGGLARDNSTWMEIARALVAEAQATATAADTKNGEALAQAGDDVYTTCETCHMKYLEQ